MDTLQILSLILKVKYFEVLRMSHAYVSTEFVDL
jgi:hypothetical protein